MKWNVLRALFIFSFLSVHCHDTVCDMNKETCEIFLEVSYWLPMRAGPKRPVYINETDGKLYEYRDASHTAVDPHDVVLADGSNNDRLLTLFNASMPGPTLIVYKNQEVLVHVTNKLLSNGVSVHFHGIEMRGTPWMDGASFITQCPILPGQTFTYKFRPNKSGTFIYHSHTGSQVSSGLFGPFIVKEKQLDDIEENIMVIQDYNNKLTGDDQYAQGVLLGIFTPSGEPLGPNPFIDGSVSSVFPITSTLINGRGRVFADNGTETTHIPLTVFEVIKGRRYRFRVIGGGFTVEHKVSVDGHKIILVATDGIEIDPVETDFFIMHSGERFDFMINASEDGNFWIRSETLHSNKNYTGLAILRYKGASEVDPATKAKECTVADPCTVVNCQIDEFPTWKCIHIDELKAPNTDNPAPSAMDGIFKEFFVSVGFGLTNDGMFKGHMRGVSLKIPTVSALTQPREVTEACDDSSNCAADKLCICNNPLVVNFGDIVQINFISMGFRGRVNHPVHVHGYSFHVLKLGYRLTNASMAILGNNPEINCHSENMAMSLCNNGTSWKNDSWNGGNIPEIDLSRAPRKDTLVVPAGGYAVVRFKADNPGLWYIHCHQEIHASQLGMGLLLNDSFDRIPPPPAGFPECRNFPPPQWITNSLHSSGGQTNAALGQERSRFEAYLRGMFVALLLVEFCSFWQYAL